ncbi:unnamed protein product [Diamesa tonsa]
MESVQENKYNRDLTLTLNHGDLNQKIEEFKTKNPEQVDELKLFLKEVLMEAEQVAQSDEAKEKNLNSFMTGLKSRRVVTRARSLAVRIFDTIVSCTNNIPNQIPARLRRQQTTYDISTNKGSPRRQTRFE